MALRDRNPCSDPQAPLTSFSPSADPRAIIAHAREHGVTLRLDDGEQPGAHAVDVGGGIVAVLAPAHEPSDAVAGLLVELRHWIGTHANVHGLRWALRKERREARAAETAEAGR